MSADGFVLARVRIAEGGRIELLDELSGEVVKIGTTYDRRARPGARGDTERAMLDGVRAFDVRAECERLGVDHARLSAALDASENWGALVHAFEFLTAVGVTKTALWRSDSVRDSVRV